MARLAGFLLAACALAAAAEPPKGIPCRNVKSDAQCAADERAQARERAKAGADQATEVRTPNGAVLVEKITVEANPEDRAAPELTRWEKFDRGLQGEKVVEFVGNDGVRQMCLDPCKRGINCCVRGREFTTTGREAGR
ncbi:hypothetical protein BWI17_14275 [Betaproteobacteria bacterium GR16-43]|nr:hypothetical protein BWI17_14275 [Betaproteobacteria bacterium GR16-43]